MREPPKTLRVKNQYLKRRQMKEQPKKLKVKNQYLKRRLMKEPSKKLKLKNQYPRLRQNNQLKKTKILNKLDPPRKKKHKVSSQISHLRHCLSPPLKMPLMVDELRK